VDKVEKSARSGDHLAASIMAFIDTYNRLHAHPYRWTYTGEALASWGWVNN
jgi:hypothetical protein